MIKLTEVIGYPNLEWHLHHKKRLSENIYRYSSDSFLNLFREAREAHTKGIILLEGLDKELVETTDIGLFGEYEGSRVPLDMPMEQVGDTIECKKCKHSWEMDLDDARAELCHKCGYDNKSNSYDMEALQAWKELNEAKYQGKEVALNKPKRGGSKKFFVYTKNPKTGKVIKVSFGAAGGGQNLAVKLDDPKRRKAFADRHKCSTKKDKTKPGYWACRLTRYARQLGMKKNYSGYW